MPDWLNLTPVRKLKRAGRLGTREFLWTLYSRGEGLFEGLKIRRSTRQTWKFQGRSLARVRTTFISYYWPKQEALSFPFPYSVALPLHLHMRYRVAW